MSCTTASCSSIKGPCHSDPPALPTTAEDGGPTIQLPAANVRRTLSIAWLRSVYALADSWLFRISGPFKECENLRLRGLPRLLMIWLQFAATALVIVLAGVRLARYGDVLGE